MRPAPHWYRDNRVPIDLRRLITVATPNPLVIAWRWRYEIALVAGLSAGLAAAIISFGAVANDRRSNRHNPDNFVLAHSPAVRSRSRLVHHHNTSSARRLRRRVDLFQPRQDPHHLVDISSTVRRTSPAMVPRRHQR